MFFLLSASGRTGTQRNQTRQWAGRNQGKTNACALSATLRTANKVVLTEASGNASAFIAFLSVADSLPLWPSRFAGPARGKCCAFIGLAAVVL